MEKTNVKKISDSATEQVQIVLFSHTNSTGRLFGGQLMLWIDIVAAVVGRRHSGYVVTTAAVSDLSFHAPVYVGDTIVLKGRITHVGRTSMEVKVDTYSESTTGEQKLVNTAYVVVVALNNEGKPIEVPGIEPETEEERRELETAERKHSFQKERQ